ncbi:hypothetical protein CHI10_15635 [Bacillus sp. 7894-2]|nr:hypothetical protein CHI10_15635 [Bacillus sp. 7894-2]
MNSMQYLINVPIEDVKQCFSFAEQLYQKKAASLKQFGRKQLIREKNDYIADHVIGKSVEIGFKRFLEINCGISFKVDFDIWEDQLIHDNGNDLATVFFNGESKKFTFKTDIKGTRKSSKWLLVERHKIVNFNTKIYVVGLLDSIPEGKAFENNPYGYLNHSWNVRILGYALNRDIVDPQTKRGWIEYKKGDHLYSPSILEKCKSRNRNLSHSEYQKLLNNVIKNIPENWNRHIGGPLDCEINYGLPIKWLRNTNLDWENFCKIINKYSS